MQRKRERGKKEEKKRKVKIASLTRPFVSVERGAVMVDK
jgi:hypothetical protein